MKKYIIHYEYMKTGYFHDLLKIYFINLLIKITHYMRFSKIKVVFLYFAF